jgi:4-diphosphocytidyl-2-C-methyl-D-erythritol kinase
MSHPAGKLFLKAPAKINLCLNVLGRREDGYHELETWMQKLDLCDSVTIELVDKQGISLFCDDPFLPAGKDNLVCRAADIFLKAAGCPSGTGVKITLEKKIPVAAGLGGGSSDAGSVLKGLNALFGRPLSEEKLLQLGRRLGADVPFFVTDHDAVIARGIGDIMHPVDSLLEYTFVLVNPGFFVSTGWVFDNLFLTTADKKYNLSCFQKRNAGFLPLELMCNDLEKVTSARYPEIDEMKKMLLDFGAVRALMSGSGATVFGVFPHEKKPGDLDFKRIAGGLIRKFGKKVFIAKASAGAWPSG